MNVLLEQRQMVFCQQACFENINQLINIFQAGIRKHITISFATVPTRVGTIVTNINSFDGSIYLCKLNFEYNQIGISREDINSIQKIYSSFFDDIAVLFLC